MSAAAAAFDPAVALAGTIAPVRKSPLYVLALLFVACFMVLMPLVYVAVVAGVAWGVQWWIFNAWEALPPATSGGGRRARLFAFVAVPVVGAILVAFMVKPFFAPRARVSTGLALRREDQPRLFDFVERLCAALGAPAPREIKLNCDVNASAGFRRGFASMLGRDLTLTIGLPLAAGLSLRQLAGILAHEFGHFAQGTGMRASYVIGSINRWFARMVYERDAWDEWLVRVRNASAGFWMGYVLMLVWLIQAVVWLTRGLLWLLMHAGLLLSGFMLRQMEFDADRYEARLAGSDAFERTAREMRLLSVAGEAAHANLARSWTERRLADNLPELLLHWRREMPKDVRQRVLADSRARRTGWFDSHPADGDRVRSAQREAAAGILRSDAPARDLFDNFEATCRTLTFVHYNDFVGEIERSNLVPIGAYLAEGRQSRAESDTVERFFGAAPCITRPFLFVPDSNAPALEPRAAAQQLRAARRELREARERIGRLVARAEQLTERLATLARGHVLARGGFRFSAREFEVEAASVAGVEAARSRARRDLDELERSFESIDELATRRLLADLRLLECKPCSTLVPDAAALAAEARRLLPLLRELQPLLRKLPDIHLAYVALLTAAECLNIDKENALLQSILRARVDEISRFIAERRANFRDVPYPFEHAGGPTSVARFLLESTPDPHDPGQVLSAASTFFDRTGLLYARILARLTYIAIQVEQALQQAARARQAAETPVDPAA